MVLKINTSTMLCCWLQILQSCTFMVLKINTSTMKVQDCRICNLYNTTCTEDQHQHHVVGCRSCSPVPLMVLVLIFSTCCVVGCRSCSPVPLMVLVLIFSTCCVVGCRSCSPVPFMVLVLIFSTCCVVGCRSCSPVPSWCWC